MKNKKSKRVVIPALGITKKMNVTVTKTVTKNKIEIPESVDQKAEESIHNMHSSVPKAPEKSITEIQEQKDLSAFKFVAWLNTNMYKFLEFAIKYEVDYLTGKWHYIPRLINPEYRHEHDNKAICVELFCIDDKMALKRLNKIAKRFSPGKQIEWMDYDANDVKKSLEITETLMNNPDYKIPNQDVLTAKEEVKKSFKQKIKEAFSKKK